MKSAAALIVSVLFCYIVKGSGELCSMKENVRTCNLDSNATALRLFDDRLLTGSENALYSFGIDLELQQKVELPSDNSTVLACNTLFLANCESNYIKVIEPIPGTNKILVCGTHSHQPRCSLHDKDQLGDFEMSTVSNMGYSPIETNLPIFALVATNQRFFGAIPVRQMGMSPNPLQSNRSFSITVEVKRNNLILDSETRFVGAYEHNDYIYFFVSEPAAPFDLETSTSNSDRPTYSKVLRICKSDNGIDSSSFSTLQKARIQCNNDDYVYNEITSTYIAEENGEPVIYATFIAPRNGPTGSAICKYSFSVTMTGSLTKVFEEGMYFVQNSSTNAWEKRSGPVVRCSDPRIEDEAQMYVHSFSPVTAVLNEEMPRPLAKVDGESLGNIATEILNVNGSTREIFYYTNDQGQVKQRIANMPYSHMLVDGEMGKNGDYETIQSILIRKEADGYGSSVYVSRGTKIMQISRGRCEEHATCHACLQSGDPYCGWHSETKSCRNRIKREDLNLVQSYSTQSSDVVSICRATLNPSSPTAPSFTDVQTKESTDPNKSFAPSITAGKRESLQGALSIPAVIGAAMGTFIIGLLLGLFVCILFLSARTRFMTKRQTYQVQDQSKSNNETVADTNVTLKEVVTITEPKEDLRSNSNSTQRYVDHTLPQKVQAQTQDEEVTTNIIEVEKVDLQNSQVVDASPVKIGNGHIIGNTNASSQSSILSEPVETSEISTAISDSQNNSSVAVADRSDTSVTTTDNRDNPAPPNRNETKAATIRNDTNVATPPVHEAVKINHMPPTPTTPKFSDSSQGGYKASRPAPLSTSGQNAPMPLSGRTAPMTPGARNPPTTPGGRIPPTTPGGRIPPTTPGGRIPPTTPGGRFPPMTPGSRVPPMASGRYMAGSSNTLPHNRYANRKETNMFNFATDEHDSAFAETDVVPPLMNVSTKFNSLGRNKSTGVARRQVPNYKVPKGRTDSTTWLRQESVSSDISPLQSPISDV